MASKLLIALLPFLFLSLIVRPTTADELPTSVDELPTADKLPTTVDELPTTAGKLPTGADELPTGADKLPTSVDQLPTGADKLPITADKLPTGADELPTGADKLPTTVDELPTGADKLPTTVDELPTGADKLPTTDDKLPTTADELPDKPLQLQPKPQKQAEKVVDVVVEGQVYCQSCKHRGTWNLNGASLIENATIGVICKNHKSRISYYKAFETRKEGHFYAELKGFKTSNSFLDHPLHACKVKLVASPLSTCNQPTNINYGLDGAPLKYENKRISGPYYEAIIYSAGKLAFRRKDCVLDAKP